MTAKVLILLIRVYRVVLSPFVGGACRFLPVVLGVCRRGDRDARRVARRRSWRPGACRAAILSAARASIRFPRPVLESRSLGISE